MLLEYNLHWEIMIHNPDPHTSDSTVHITGVGLIAPKSSKNACHEREQQPIKRQTEQMMTDTQPQRFNGGEI